MKLCAILAMAILAACTTANARLGETVKQVEHRYGKPVDGTLSAPGPEFSKYGDQLGRYQKDVYQIGIIFNAGKSVYESFHKTNSYGMAALSGSDVEFLLGANAGDSAWTKQRDGQRWSRNDGAAVAWLGADRTTFTLHLVEAARKGL